MREWVVVLALVAACDKKKGEDAPTPSAKVDPKADPKMDPQTDPKADPKPDPATGSGDGGSAAAGSAAAGSAAAGSAAAGSAAADPAKADAMAGWTERKGDGFSVMAPQDPKVTTKETTATGKPLPTTMYTHYVPDGPGAVQVMYTDLDPKAKLDTKKMFDAMRDSMLKQFNGTVAKHEEIKMGEAKGHEYWLEGDHPRMGKMGVHVKFLLHKKRLYLVQSLHAADAKDFAAQGDKFIESFKLL